MVAVWTLSAPEQSTSRCAAQTHHCSISRTIPGAAYGSARRPNRRQNASHGPIDRPGHVGSAFGLGLRSDGDGETPHPARPHRSGAAGRSDSEIAEFCFARYNKRLRRICRDGSYRGVFYKPFYNRAEMRVLSSRDRQESRWRVTGAQQAVAHDPRRTTKDVFISVPTSKMYTTLSHRILHVQLNPFSTFQGAPLRPDCKTDHWRALPAPAIGDAANLCSVKAAGELSSG